MAKYRKISPRLWNDPVFRNLSESARAVFFLLLTHPHTSAVGTLRAFPAGLAPELGWGVRRFNRALNELQEQDLVRCDARWGLIRVVGFMRDNLPESPNVLRSWAGALEDCPLCALRDEVLAELADVARSMGPGFGRAFAEVFGPAAPEARNTPRFDRSGAASESPAALPDEDRLPAASEAVAEGASEPAPENAGPALSADARAQPAPAEAPACAAAHPAAALRSREQGVVEGFAEALAEGFQEGFQEGFPQAGAPPFPNQEQEQEQELPPYPPSGGTRAGRLPRQPRFVPPHPDEVDAYCRERANGIRGPEFCDFYAGKGWKVGSAPMRDWKAAIRTWEHRRRHEHDAAAAALN